jgi:hypothetical protein
MVIVEQRRVTRACVTCTSIVAVAKPPRHAVRERHIRCLSAKLAGLWKLLQVEKVQPKIQKPMIKDPANMAPKSSSVSAKLNMEYDYR